MITDLLSSILQELSELIKVKDLHPDSNNSCLIKFPNGIDVQLELDARGEFLILGTTVGSVPPGRYRENIFREALKANGMPQPRFGVFAYSKKSDQLVLFDQLHCKDLTGAKVFDHLTPFLDKALVWKEALIHSEIPSIIGSYSGVRPAGMFGIKP